VVVANTKIEKEEKKSMATTRSIMDTTFSELYPASARYLCATGGYSSFYMGEIYLVLLLLSRDQDCALNCPRKR
tara:strand:- start:298 stop:519 length:222 start_codon:yes stop_codon:yes gene_type:complete